MPVEDSGRGLIVAIIEPSLVCDGSEIGKIGGATSPVEDAVGVSVTAPVEELSPEPVTGKPVGTADGVRTVLIESKTLVGSIV